MRVSWFRTSSGNATVPVTPAHQAWLPADPPSLGTPLRHRPGLRALPHPPSHTPYILELKDHCRLSSFQGQQQ